MSARPRTRGLAAGVALSVGIHVAAAWTIAVENTSGRPESASTASNGEFVELPPIEAPEVADARESDEPTVAIDEVRTAPTGLRVRHVSSMPHLSLSAFGPSLGPFGLRDRLTVGRYDPHVIPSLDRMPNARQDAERTPTENADSPELAADADAPLVAETEPSVGAPEATEAPPAADPAAIVPTEVPVEIIEEPAADAPRLRTPSSADEIVSLWLSAAPTSFPTQSALDAVADAPLRAALGLDDASLRRVVRLRPHRSRSSVTAFSTSLEASELRIRLEAMMRARGETAEFAEREGTFTTTLTIDDTARTIVIDRGILLVADAGGIEVAGEAIARIRAADDVAADPSTPRITARFSARSTPESVVTSVEIDLFEPAESGQPPRVRVRATVRHSDVDDDPTTTPLAITQAAMRELGYTGVGYEIPVPGILENGRLEFDAYPVGVTFADLAARLAARR